MTPTNKIFINATSQYIRIVLCMLMSLYSTRIILGILGQSDFGIYTLIGSMVMLVSFLTSSLATSTQRFLSHSWGAGDVQKVKTVFANAFLLHIGLALIIGLVMCCCENIIVHQYLHIDQERLQAADMVYYMVLTILMLTFVSSPIKALFIARENIVFTSVVEILEGACKLGGAIGLMWVTADTLIAYAILMASTSLVSFCIYFIFALHRYEECHIPKLREQSSDCMRKMLGFTVWNIYAVGSTVIRSQGIAVIINRFLGILVNAAYGIALQVSGAISAIAAAIINAINPQLMKAEGRGDREQMLHFATLESKYSFLILSTFLIPVLLEMPSILTFWLKQYPEYAVEFCSLFIIAILIDQLTIGLTSANQAIGKIRNYSLITSTIRLLTLPGIWIALKYGCSLFSVLALYLLFDILCGMSRVPILKRTAGLHVREYFSHVLLHSLVPVAGSAVICYCIMRFTSFPARFVFTEMAGVVTSVILIYFFSLDRNEKKWINTTILQRLRIK